MIQLNQNDFVPTNGMVLLEEIEEEPKKEEDADIVAFAASSKKKKESFQLKPYRILAVSSDVQPRLREAGKGKLALVEYTMIEEFVYGDMKLKLIHEKHVRGIFVGMIPQ